MPRTRYAYDPHLPPVLRFDPSGKADQLPDLLQIAQQRALTAEEVQLLAEALGNRQPWLEWAGKQEKAWFEVDVMAVSFLSDLSNYSNLTFSVNSVILYITSNNAVLKMFS